MGCYRFIGTDIVLTIALHQFLTARRYLNKENDTKTYAEERLRERLNPLRLKAIYFALMGGFSSIISPESRITTNALHTINHLCRRRTIENIRKYPLSEVKERSKASGLEKFWRFSKPAGYFCSALEGSWKGYTFIFWNSIPQFMYRWQ